MEIDFSQLQTFIDCPRKYFNRYVLNLRKVKYDERDLDRDFGSCIHSALESLYKDKDVAKAKQWFRENFVGLETEKAKTPANGERLIEDYWTHWNKPVNDLDDTKLETVAVEVVDKFNITANLDYIVKIDRIVKSNSGYWVMDHKTTRSIAYNYFYQFDPNMQMSGYCEYVRQKCGQYSGAIINVISVGHRKRKYKDQPAGFYCSFCRDIVNRNEQQLDVFKQNVIEWCRRLAQSEALSLYPRNESACHQYRGCGFKELCTSCDDEEIKNTLYETYESKEYLNGK